MRVLPEDERQGTLPELEKFTTKPGIISSELLEALKSLSRIEGILINNDPLAFVEAYNEIKTVREYLMENRND